MTINSSPGETPVINIYGNSSNQIIYRQPWPHSQYHFSGALPGEKLNTTDPLTELNDQLRLIPVNYQRTELSQTTNHHMLKFESIDADSLDAIDPHIVQPIIGYDQCELLPTLDDLIDQEQKGEKADFAEVESLSPKVNPQMEQCISLDLYVTPVGGNVDGKFSDELNTPILETSVGDNIIKKHCGSGNPFHFPKFDEEKGIISNNNLTAKLNNFIKLNGSERTLDKEQSSVNIFSLVHINNLSNNNVNSSIITSNKMDTEDSISIDLNEYDLLSDCNDFEEYFLNFNKVKVESNDEDKQNDYNETSDHHNYALKLNLNGKPVIGEVLPTPDVINNIVSLEKDFNLFNYMQDTTTTTTSKFLPETFFIDGPQYPEESSSASSEASAVTLPVKVEKEKIRKRKLEESDEDYIPNSPATPGDDSDDSDYCQTTKKQPRRGRPPVRRSRGSSIASNSSHHSESSKYRVMRDKNNEASRRSRLKRKEQEQSYEVERQELQEKNLKLKARVAELDKMVTGLRTNLMQLLMKNKT